MITFLLIVLAILFIVVLAKAWPKKGASGNSSHYISDEKYARLTCKRSSNTITWDEAQDRKQYLYCDCEVKGIIYRDEEGQAAAKALSVGDKLILEAEPTNENDPSAIKVLTEAGVHIGYLPKKTAENIGSWLAEVKLCAVYHRTTHELPYIYCKIFFSSTYAPFSTLNVSVSIQTDETFAFERYPELKTADGLKRTNPQLAIEILKPIMDIEKSLEAKRMCCIAYREMKAYDEELEVLKKILVAIDNVQPSDVSSLEYQNMKAGRPQWEKRLAYVERVIRNRDRRLRKSATVHTEEKPQKNIGDKCMKTMNFVALDVETATAKRSSVCQLSLVFVNDGQIDEKRTWLIQPPENKYSAFNSSLHGIDAETTANAPTFPEVWPEIKQFLDGQTVVAHFTGFDMYALRDALDLYELEYPQFEFFCSMRLSKEIIRKLPNHTLPIVYSWCFGEQLENHHNATSDAEACAKIMCKLFELAEADSFESIAGKYRIVKGVFGEGMFVPAKKRRDYSNRVDVMERIVTPSGEEFDENNYFFGKTVCFTGKLSYATRVELLQKIADVGGTPVNSVTKKTDVLVVGQQDYRVVGDDGMSSKQEKAMKMIEDGHPIEVLSESDFLQLIN